MDHQRIDDALEARSVNDNKKRPRPPTLRRRNHVRLKRHQRRPVPRGDDDGDAASGVDSGPDSGPNSGPDSEDEDITIPRSRATSLLRPSATLRVGSGLAVSSGTTFGGPQHTTLRFGDTSRSTIGAAQSTPFRFGVSSRTTIGAAQSTPVRLAPAIITSLARPTGLGSTLLASEGDDLDSGVESLSDDDDSDDETTSSATSATTAPNPGDITTSNSLTSTTAATLSSSSLSAAPSLSVIETSLAVTSASSSLAQSTTLSTAVVATPASNSGKGFSSNSSVAEQTMSPTQSAISAPSVTPAPISTPSLPSPQRASTQTTTASGSIGAAIPDQVLGGVTSTEHEDMSQGEVTGTVIGVLAGFTVIVMTVFFVIKKLRRRGYRISSLRLPFGRTGSGDTMPPRATTSTAWAAPWNRNLWGTASNDARSTVSGFRKKKQETNSEMLDKLVQASYAAESGAGIAEEKTRRRLTDLESQSPPSPGSFLDENFINEKSYAKLEGPWPFRNSPRGNAAAPKTPGPVARWLDGILTPRQSTAVPPPALVTGDQMTTKWQPEPPLPGAKAQGFEGLPPLDKPTPAFAKGSVRNTRMTNTTTTSSSVVW